MGAPAFEYKTLFKKNYVHVFSANFALYGDMSNRVMQILENYSPDMEVYSIDECFLKLSGFEHFDLPDYGAKMRTQVVKWTGIPICVGIAPTKALAKVANRIAKKFPIQTQGVYCIDTEEKRIKALKWLQVEDIWGIGRKHAKRLKAYNIHNAYAFTQLTDSWVKSQMSVVGLRLKHDLQGIPTLDLEVIQTKKNIATTRSFEKNIVNLEELKERISTFAVSCAEKLRKEKCNCKTITVFLQTNRHRTELPQYNRSISVKLPYATSSSLELSNFAIAALKKIYKPDYMYKKAGVIIQDFTPEDNVQTTLFNTRNENHIPLMKTIDRLNASLGQQKIRLGSQDLKRVWKMKQEKLSPRYTTNLNEIITINA